MAQRRRGAVPSSDTSLLPGSWGTSGTGEGRGNEWAGSARSRQVTGP